MEFEKETGSTNKLNQDNNQEVNVEKKKLPRGPEPKEIEDLNEEIVIDPDENEVAKFSNRREMVQALSKEVGFNEVGKAIEGENYIPGEKLKEAKNQGNKNIIDESNDGGEIIIDPIDKMTSTFKREEEGDKMTPPKMKVLSDFIPTIEGGIDKNNGTTKIHHAKKDNKGFSNKISEVE